VAAALSPPRRGRRARSRLGSGQWSGAQCPFGRLGWSQRYGRRAFRRSGRRSVARERQGVKREPRVRSEAGSDVTFRNAFSWSSVKVMRGASLSASLSTLMGAKGDGTRLNIKTPLSSSSSSKSMRIAQRRGGAQPLPAEAPPVAQDSRRTGGRNKVTFCKTIAPQTFCKTIAPQI
jgi:hypothetical protein